MFSQVLVYPQARSACWRGVPYGDPLVVTSSDGLCSSPYASCFGRIINDKDYSVLSITMLGCGKGDMDFFLYYLRHFTF